MRLDKLLSNMGYGTRKEVKKLMKKGAVRVNAEPVKDAALHVDTVKDEVTILGEKVIYKEFMYLMMNKPQGGIICN